LLAVWRFNEDTGGLCRLVELGDLVQVSDSGIGVSVEVLAGELQEFAQREAVQSSVIWDGADVHPSE